MNWMLVDEFDNFLIADVVGDEIHISRDFRGSIVLVLEESESGPFRMNLPKFENGFSALEGASSRQVKDGVLFAGNFRIVEVL